MDIRTLEQKRAEFAYNKVLEVRGTSEEIQKKYRSYVRSAPTLILTNGLGQTLAFYLSKIGNSNGDYEEINLNDLKKADQKAYAYLYKHIAEWLDEKIIHSKNPIEYYTRASSTEVLTLTEEVIALLKWMRRFADAMLKGDERGEE
ncbi:type III-B CRISPR module-associated protein Cmr5 [Thermococcus chitonophagus]|uniref:CRISPR type III-B/RAMP module-associated protein Cmr5 n=1 Tax=Thermococcus chitonophagus TaxID=54262 RepID=A0A160VRT7_9EURY|nr:type III-B CRISPR module-associated protein Cmr5 [Thermococcus chitonophagus]ASJ16080.1 type III-B CRISPR module-associated protein Cmr5 [Thermococcus chitonophagus]CUX77329.1 CRISPR-associated RAMP Cmr5 [Thermococcus chitonophagus]